MLYDGSDEVKPHAGPTSLKNSRKNRWLEIGAINLRSMGNGDAPKSEVTPERSSSRASDKRAR